MKLEDLHSKISKHYVQARSLKHKNSIHIESVIGQTYKKKASDAVEMSPVEDFLRN